MINRSVVAGIVIFYDTVSILIRNGSHIQTFVTSCLHQKPVIRFGTDLYTDAVYAGDNNRVVGSLNAVQLAVVPFLNFVP